MTDITVKNETESGAAVIELRGLATSDTRFRLYDIAADKYLTKRGWTKTPSALPAEAVLVDDLITIPLDAELARKIAPRTSLSLEQPSTDFRQVFLWARAEAPVVPDEAVAADEPITVEAALADLAADQPANPEPAVEPAMTAAPAPEAKTEPTKEAPAEEPETQDTRSAVMANLFAEDEPRQTWLPTAIAAALFLVLGFGLAYLLIGSSSDADVQQVTQAAEQQRAKDQADFARQLADVQTVSKVSDVKIAEASTKAAELAAARDEALKAAADKDNALRDLQTRLDAATTEIESFKASGEKVDARVAELTTQAQALAADRDAAFKTIADKDALVKDLDARLAAAQADSQDSAALTAALDKARSDLAEREKVLRDVQSKLEVADVQIDALKTMAGKNSEANLEKSALEDKIAQLMADLDTATKSAGDSKAKLAELDQKLLETETMLATATSQRETDQQGVAVETASSEATSQLRQERDLYAKELKALTDNFAILKAQNDQLEKQIATLKGTDKGPSVAGTPDATTDTLWGASAIDMSGAIYAVNNQATKASAQANALAKCRNQSDFGCKALTSFQNSCFSVARFQDESPATDNYAFSVDANWKRSAAESLGRCERRGSRCTVRFTTCSPDSLSKPKLASE